MDGAARYIEPSAKRRRDGFARLVVPRVGRVRVSAGAAVLVGLLALASVAGGQGSAVVSPKLVETATARGSVRLVVQLKVTAGADAAEITAAKQRLRTDLAGASYRILRDLPGLPTVVLEASPGALAALAGS